MIELTLECTAVVLLSAVAAIAVAIAIAVWRFLVQDTETWWRP